MNIPHIHSVRPLRDLPNETGFKFVGITHKWERIDCVVYRESPNGLHKVRGVKFDDLLGWVPACH